ncbi:helix-turn-helix transcriptional regulator [Actinoplanes sp. DH11]|uniref:ArsR/SmtB family transcription factor n=1 Tax=Actinoplanes sp. DH11 TaxID=2857011 RepID=UPI001E39A299|nr:metalloregulator ArsR/SmtB family transcription factor [Actinoplanes sp. DH11]
MSGEPVSGPSVIGPDDLERAVEVLRGMAYQHRLHILVVLRGGEATPAELCERIPAHPTAISHHLRNLADAGLIQRRRRGRNVFYSLPGEPTGKLIDDILSFVAR